MFDLLFIIFDSANLSLAFDTLFDTRWSCRSPQGFGDGIDDVSQRQARSISLFLIFIFQTMRTIEPICTRQRALAAFLFLALCGWVITFTISVFRYAHISLRFCLLYVLTVPLDWSKGFRKPKLHWLSSSKEKSPSLCSIHKILR